MGQRSPGDAGQSDDVLALLVELRRHRVEPLVTALLGRVGPRTREHLDDAARSLVLAAAAVIDAGSDDDVTDRTRPRAPDLRERDLWLARLPVPVPVQVLDEGRLEQAAGSRKRSIA